MQIQINCPYFRTSMYINNGVQQKVHVCADQGCQIDPIEYCIGSKCKFVNIEPKVEQPVESEMATKAEATENEINEKVEA